MSQSVVLVEEESARIVATELAARLEIAPSPIIIPHQGKQDLERSIRNKLARWRATIAPRFVILRDNDGMDCKRLKRQLAALVPEAALPRTKVRLVLQELESWYFGDLPALVSAGLVDEREAERLPKQKKYRDPDVMTAPKAALRSMLTRSGEAQQGQILLARRISPHLSLANNRSTSFLHFVDALRWSAEG